MMAFPIMDDAFPEAWFFADGETNPGQGVAIAVFYMDLKTNNPKFSMAVQPTPGTKIEVYD